MPHEIHAERGEELMEVISKIILRPRIHDAMRGVVEVPDFAEAIETEVREAVRGWFLKGAGGSRT